MMRVNLLKRLESSVHSFALTMGRVLDKMDELDRKIVAWRERGVGDDVEVRPDGDEEEDEDFAVGRGVRYRLDELDVDRWLLDLREDRRAFDDLRRRAERVGVERDAKLAELKRVLRRKAEAAPVDKDGRANRKALVFTAFADTARYLYDNLRDWARRELGVRVALVAGGDVARSGAGETGFLDVLARFAPRARRSGDAGGEEIDVLIATDCLSEGQDLQDCDLVVNYDIHWNPVRLMQRFGRIDRLGGRSRKVAMTNFWPTADLDRYLDLKNRVEARMALADAAATGLDDPLDRDAPAGVAAREAAQGELAFRDRQLERLREEILDVETADDGVSMSDLTLDDFLADLLRYIQSNRAALEAAPPGVMAVVDGRTDGASAPVPPGAIFCLRRGGDPAQRTPNRLWPYFLVHVRRDGTVRHGFRQARQCLALFRALAAGRKEANAALENAFDRETDHGRRMAKYDGLLAAALRDVAATFRDAELAGLSRDRGARLTEKPARPGAAAEWELVTWLVIAAPDARPGPGA